MPQRTPRRRLQPAVDSLEGRALLSAGVHQPLIRPHALQVGRLHSTAIKTDPAAVAAIMNAINGGMGSEWISLIRAGSRNLGKTISGFLQGRYPPYTIPGLTVKAAGVSPQFTGSFYDQLSVTAAGATILKGNVLELGAIMRGPFHDPATTYYTFALDRGAGAHLGPTFASRPGITPDTLVTITVGPYGSSATGTMKDLTTGATQSIDPSNIRIVASTLRVYLDAGQLPSHGLPVAKYRYAFWAQTQPGNDIATVASFAPDYSMNKIAVLRTVKATH